VSRSAASSLLQFQPLGITAPSGWAAKLLLNFSDIFFHFLGLLPDPVQGSDFAGEGITLPTPGIKWLAKSAAIFAGF
jgi:hypothetical protein